MTSVLVGLLAQKAEVKYDPTKTNPDVISKWIVDLGFESKHMSHNEGAQSRVEIIVCTLIHQVMYLITCVQNLLPLFRCFSC